MRLTIVVAVFMAILAVVTAAPAGACSHVCQKTGKCLRP